MKGFRDDVALPHARGGRSQVQHGADLHLAPSVKGEFVSNCHDTRSKEIEYLVPFLCRGLGNTTEARARCPRSSRSLLIHGNTRQKDRFIRSSSLASDRHTE